MYQLNIGVGWSALRLLFLPRWINDKTKVCDILEQHRIILSEKIRTYYLNCATEEGLDEDVMAYLASVSYTEESCLEIEDFGRNIKDTLVHYFNKKSYLEQVMIYDEDELKCSKSKCKFQYSIDQAINADKGPLALYNIPTHFQFLKNSSANVLLFWLSNIFKEEKSVNFIDPYLFSNDENISFFIDKYLPLIEPGTVLNIHCPSSCGINYHSLNRIILTAKSNNVDTHIFFYSDMHDRYVTTIERVVSIGTGLDMINDDLKFKKGTTFSVWGKRVCNNDLLEIEKELAGTFYREYVPVNE